MASKALTDNQRSIQKTLDIASQVVIMYSGTEVPDLGNLTPEGLLEEFGRLNEARKLLWMPSAPIVSPRCLPEGGPRVVEIIDLAPLWLQRRQVNRATIDPRRGSRLEAIDR